MQLVMRSDRGNRFCASRQFDLSMHQFRTVARHLRSAILFDHALVYIDTCISDGKAGSRFSADAPSTLKCRWWCDVTDCLAFRLPEARIHNLDAIREYNAENFAAIRTSKG